MQCGWDYIDKTRYEGNYRNDFTRGNYRGNIRTSQTYRGQKYRGGYRKMKIMRGGSSSQERQYPESTTRNDRSSSSRSRSGSWASTNRDRMRYYKCREYDHFAKDSLTSKWEKNRTSTTNV